VTQLLVSDLEDARAAAVAVAANAEAVPADELLARSDAVVIATDTASHAVLIRQAVEAGCSIFCEKPIALDLETTRAVMADIAWSSARGRRYPP
jgi:myo-inositol 2-dehydrogenase/D-chiro-inositol 1-dehydrogenase